MPGSKITSVAVSVGTYIEIEIPLLSEAIHCIRKLTWSGNMRRRVRVRRQFGAYGSPWYCNPH